MTKFDKFVCEYAKHHTRIETIKMLESHISYIEFCKYDHSVKTVKADDNKIGHLKAMIHFLQLCTETNFPQFKEVYFND